MEERIVILDGNSLTIDDVVGVSRFNYRVKLSSDSEKKISTIIEKLPKKKAREILKKVSGLKGEAFERWLEKRYKLVAKR